MALAGLHVVFAGARPSGPLDPYTKQGEGVSLLESRSMSSQTLASPGTSTIEAPSYDTFASYPVVSLRASRDAWVAIGPNPDPSTNPRRYLAANTDADISVNPGDRIAWAYA